MKLINSCKKGSGCHFDLSYETLMYFDGKTNPKGQRRKIYRINLSRSKKDKR